MGKNYSRLVPNYFRNFNIEKRVSRQMDKLETEKVLEISPRHPSTVETLKKFEGLITATCNTIVIIFDKFEFH